MRITKVDLIKRNPKTYRGSSKRALLRQQREYVSNTRIYVWPKGESFLENLDNRRSRPYNAWRSLILKELRDAGIGVNKLVWSQKAGCDCGCSPGFIVHTNSYGPIRDEGEPCDIHIDMCM